MARLEATCLLLAISCLVRFKLYQNDVNSAFFNGILNEEAYVEQLEGFEDSKYPNYVCKLKKACMI